jgi:hypothetical protein
MVSRESMLRNTGELISPYPYILPEVFFDGENISFDASLVIYIYICVCVCVCVLCVCVCINSTNIPPIMIINRIYENQNLLSL